MKPSLLKSRPRGLLLAALGAAFVAAVFLGLSYLLPALSSSDYDQRSLGLLRSKARDINAEFAELTSSLEKRRTAAAGLTLPLEEKALWSKLKDFPLDKNTEGAGYYGPGGKLAAWFGSVLDLEPLFMDESSGFPPKGRPVFVLASKASVYLLAVQDMPGGGRLALFRLLAFKPQFKSPYLEDYQFLSPAVRPGCQVDYWDFREDISGFDKIFARHEDEYIGQPRLKDESQSLIFPLRLGSKQILATVSLNAPSQNAYISSKREKWLLAFHLALLLGLILFGTSLGRNLIGSPGFKGGATLLFVSAVTAFRLAAFSMSRLENVKALAVFSPATSSFSMLGFLTRSPADIFLTALSALAVVLALTLAVRRSIGRRRNPPRLIPALAALAASVFVCLQLSTWLQRFVTMLVLNTNLNLLGFSFTVSLILLLLGIYCVLFGFLASAWTLFSVSRRPGTRWVPVLLVGAAAAVFFFLLFPPAGPAALLMILSPVLLAALPAFYRRPLDRGRLIVGGLALAALWVCFALNIDTSLRNRALIEGSLKNTILSQEVWADFFLEQSFPELDGQYAALRVFLQKPGDQDPAHAFWEATTLAKFNWYSSLEILDPNGTVLSRFSLNQPRIVQSALALAPSKDWSIYRTTISSLGKEKDHLIAYKDWFEGDVYLGRTLLSASLDYEMLPFLYSANPYFELLRAHSLPSLHAVDFRLAVFDQEGQILFNPSKIMTGLPPELLDRVQASPGGIWSDWSEKKSRFRGYFFGAGKRWVALLLPRKDLLKYAVEFLKMFFFALMIFGLPVPVISALARRGRLKRYVWSFSNRVYAAFVAVALIPLLLFTFSTRSVFSRLFSQQFADEAEIHADFARNVMEDYFFFQQEERRTPQAPPEDLVLWISSTIGNDVNLYQDGRLVSSSRAEFFDSGLLPELIDGETYYSLAVVRNPLSTMRRSIGDYAFHTLTIPYIRGDARFLISLPFPFEQQDISSAMSELVEFLLFLFAFFIILVMVFARGIRTMIVRPIQKLLEATQEAGRGNLDINLEYGPNNEMKTLVEGFNAMIRNLKQHQRDLAEMSQRAAWAEMARKVAHEIKNPLTPIQLSAEHLLRVYADRRGDFDLALKESAAYIISEVENLRKIAQEFLESSREAPLRLELVDVREVIQETLGPYKNMLSDRIEIKESYTGLPPLCLGDKSRLRMAIRNIIINAIESIPDRGEIGLSVNRSEEELTLEVRDTGQGMPAEVLARIFEPSFSTKAAGAGLGLPIAKKIVEDHGGSIRIDSRPGRGTRVFVLLPVTKS